MKRPKVTFKNVSKSYNMYSKQSEKIVEMFSTKKKAEDFHALKNVSFTIYEGDVVGIVGINGAGKSTLSNLMAKITPPTSGEVIIKGEPSLIAISAGLNNQLSGRENIRLKCLMHGISNAKINKIVPQIIEFADIGKFIDQPVKNYSSGMKAKLGFAISVHTNPDILIIDEALSVGDQTFYQKCINKMNEFKDQGKTIVFISHSISQVKSFCQKVIWMNYGQVEMYDDADIVIGKYQEFVKWFNSLSESEKKEYRQQKLNSQYQSEERLSRLSRIEHNSKKKKGKNFSFILQLSILLIALFFTVSHMFGVSFPDIINAKEKPEVVETVNVDSTEELAEEDVVSIQEDGLISVEEAKVYNNIDDTEASSVLKYGNKVFIIEQIDDLFKIQFEGKEVFTDVKNVVQVNKNSTETNDLINRFVSVYPNEIASSYMYFLAFLGGERSVLEQGIIDMPAEEVIGLGGTILQYSNHKVDYYINSQEIVANIVIHDIQLENLDYQEISDSALSDNLYYFWNDSYEVLLNTELSKISFELK